MACSSSGEALPSPGDCHQRLLVETHGEHDLADQQAPEQLHCADGHQRHHAALQASQKMRQFELVAAVERAICRHEAGHHQGRSQFREGAAHQRNAGQAPSPRRTASRTRRTATGASCDTGESPRPPTENPGWPRPCAECLDWMRWSCGRLSRYDLKNPVGTTRCAPGSDPRFRSCASQADPRGRHARRGRLTCPESELDQHPHGRLKIGP